VMTAPLPAGIPYSAVAAENGKMVAMRQHGISAARRLRTIVLRRNVKTLPSNFSGQAAP
jgi:hypothetical protein